MNYFRLFVCRSLALALLLSTAAYAQEPANAYPSKPVTVVVPFPPGGSTDIEARQHSAKISALLSQQFLVDYKPGAASMIGSAYVAKAAPDGYTLLVVTGSYPVLPAFFKDLSFDIARDLAPVSLMSKRALALIASPSFPGNDVAAYLNYAKANPGKINFGTSGAGSVSHLVGAWLHSATNTTVTFVHYKATGTIMTDLMSSRIDVSAAGLPVALPLIKAGKVLPLGFTDDRRTKLLPSVATVLEQGVPQFHYANWLGYSASGGTPAPIVNKLSEAFAKLAKLPDVLGPLEAEGGVSVGNSPGQFRQFLQAEADHWRKVIQDAGIKLEN